MNKSKVLLPFWLSVCAVFAVFSYGFVDLNLTLSSHPWYRFLQQPLSQLTHSQRPVTAAVFVVFLGVLFALWAATLKAVRSENWTFRSVFRFTAAVYAVLLLAYPALSYDIFNYMATAKMAFTWHENPYVVMPVEIPNDSVLAYTRAANKVALYGPTWLAATAVPHAAGGGNVWLTVIAFKALTSALLLGVCYLIYRLGKQATAVVFFALNPLVLMEVGVSGHNDVAMMALGLVALFWWEKRGRWGKPAAIAAFLLSVTVKGATIVLTPLAFMKGTDVRKWRLSFWVLLGLFFVAAPLREELYPWYAVWFLPFAALLYARGSSFESGLAAALSVGLELRNVPYMAMGYYEGPGPAARFILTVLPVVSYLAVFLYRLRVGKEGKRA
jgi:hypothetical protein